MNPAILIIPVGAVAIFVLSEFLLSRSSKWDVLAQKFRLTGTPPNGWRGCQFLQMEILEGNRLKKTSYRQGFGRSGTDFLMAKAFPKVSVSAGPAGLYLKRQPWNFMHPAIKIPWRCVTSVQSSGATEFVTDSVGREMQFPGQQFRKNIPGVVASEMDKLVGDVVEVRLADPSMRIHLPAGAVGNLQQYVAPPKPKAPERQASSLVGAV